jgi:hypothetical protein
MLFNGLLSTVTPNYPSKSISSPPKTEMPGWCTVLSQFTRLAIVPDALVVAGGVAIGGAARVAVAGSGAGAAGQRGAVTSARACLGYV